MEQVECKKKMVEIRALTGLNRKDFCMVFDIPYRTMTEWERGTRKAPDYLIRLMEYYVRAQALGNDGIDLLGFRSLCDNYEEILELRNIPQLRIADLSHGKAADDGYRGVHVYYQLSGNHYPIEIQYNTYYDRQFNNWLHKYVYKKDYDNSIGCHLRKSYENAKIQSEQEFKEALENVLLDSQAHR